MSETKASPTSAANTVVPPKPQREQQENPPVRAPDADTSRRPGNPKEQETRAVVGSHWKVPEHQVKGEVEILRDPSRPADSATFGTQHPPTGLSGIVRRAAYQLPDYKVKRWLLLIAADRLASAEWALSPRRPRNWLLVLSGTALLAGAYYSFRPRRQFGLWR
jgi:hypothetical protein